MSGQDSKWKTITILILVAVTIIGVSLWFNWRMTEMQMNFNRRVAANAANTNAQVTSLVDTNAELQEQILQLEQAVLDLEAWITEDQSRQNQQINNQQSDIQRLNSRIDSNSQSISRLWTEIYDLQGRLEYLEWACSDKNCTSSCGTTCDEEGDACTSGCNTGCGCSPYPYCNDYDCSRWGCSYCDGRYGCP